MKSSGAVYEASLCTFVLRHLAPTPTNCTDPHSLRRARFTLALRKAILTPAMVLGTYTAKSTRLRGSNNLYLPVSHIQLPRVMPLIVMLLKTVTTPTTFRASTATATELSFLFSPSPLPHLKSPLP